MLKAPILKAKQTSRYTHEQQIARNTSSICIKVNSHRIYKYLNIIAAIRLEEMSAHIDIERRSPQRQLSAKRGIMAEILLGRFFNTYGIHWSEPGKEIIKNLNLTKDLGDYKINNLIYDLKSSDQYSSISTYKRTDKHCLIHYIIGSSIFINEDTEDIELHIYGLRDYKKLLTINECMHKWNVKYEILNPKDFIPLKDTGLFPQLHNVKNVIMK